MTDRRDSAEDHPPFDQSTVAVEDRAEPEQDVETPDEPTPDETTPDEPTPDETVADPAGVGPRDRTRSWVSDHRRVVAAAVVVVLLLAAGGAWWWRSTTVPAGAAFVIGDLVVEEDQLDARVQTLRALYGVEPPTDPAALDTFQRDAAKSIVLSTILDTEASARGIVISDKQANDVLTRFVEQQFGPGGRAAFVEALGQAGTSEPAVLEEIARQLAVAELTSQVIGNVEVTDVELRAAFDERRADLGTPEQRSLRHIVVDSEPVARQIMDQLTAGVPFEQLAAERSLDTSTKAVGGDLGRVRRDQLSPAFGDSAFVALPGAMFGPVQTELGWYVGRVDEVVPSVPAEFDQVAEQLRAVLQAERGLERWREWIGERLVDADVRYADEYRPADSDAAPGITPAPLPGR